MSLPTSSLNELVPSLDFSQNAINCFRAGLMLLPKRDAASAATAPYRGTWGSAIVKLFGLTAASVGASEKTLRRAGVAFERIYLHPFSHATYYPGAQMMHLKLLFTHEGRMLGAQIVGGDGVDKRIDVLATAMQAGMTATGLARLELAYAPPYGAAKDPVNVAGYVAENVLTGKSRLAHADALPPNACMLDVRNLSGGITTWRLFQQLAKN
jgi:hypothetical protein